MNVIKKEELFPFRIYKYFDSEHIALVWHDFAILQNPEASEEQINAVIARCANEHRKCFARPSNAYRKKLVSRAECFTMLQELMIAAILQGAYFEVVTQANQVEPFYPKLLLISHEKMRELTALSKLKRSKEFLKGAKIPHGISFEVVALSEDRSKKNVGVHVRQKGDSIVATLLRHNEGCTTLFLKDGETRLIRGNPAWTPFIVAAILGITEYLADLKCLKESGKVAPGHNSVSACRTIRIDGSFSVIDFYTRDKWKKAYKEKLPLPKIEKRGEEKKNLQGIPKAPHVRSGGEVTMKNGTQFVRKPCIVHKERYKGHSVGTRLK